MIRDLWHGKGEEVKGRCWGLGPWVTPHKSLDPHIIDTLSDLTSSKLAYSPFVWNPSKVDRVQDKLVSVATTLTRYCYPLLHGWSLLHCMHYSSV